MTPCDESSTVHGVSCLGEISLDNLFFVHSGLSVTDFIAENIDRLSSPDYGNLLGDPAPTEVGKLGVQLLISNAELPEAMPYGMRFSDATTRLCLMTANGDLPLVHGDDIDYKDVEFGDQDEQELAQAIHEAIRRAASHIPNRSISFRDMVLVHKAIFRIRLCDHPPVNVPPM